MNEADLTSGSALEKTVRVPVQHGIARQRHAEKGALMMVMTSEMAGSLYMRHQ